MMEHSSFVNIPPSSATRDSELKLSSNGKYLVGAGSRVQVWRVEDGRQVATMDVEDVRSLAVSADGKWIAAGTSDGKVCVWDANTYKLAWSLWIGFTVVNAIDFSPESTRLVTGCSSLTFTELLNHPATVWNVATGKRVLGPLPHDYGVKAAKFSPRGDRFAAATQSSVRVYDSDHGQLLVNIPITVTPRNNGLFWSSNHLFVVSGGETNHVEASSTSTVLEWVVPDTNDDSCIALPRHGAFIACSARRSLTFWDASTHVKLDAIQYHQNILSISFSPDDRFLGIYGEDRMIVVYSVSQFVIPFIAQDLTLPLHSRPHKQLGIQFCDTALYLWKDSLLATAKTFLTTSFSESRSASHHALAIRALIRTHLRQWKAAVEDAKESIKIHPSVIGYIAKSIALVGGGNKLEGYRTCDIAFQHFQSTHVNFLLLIKAVIVFLAGDHSDAVSRLDDLIAASPFNSICCVVQAYMCLVLGNSRMRSRNYERAIQLFKRARARVRQHDSNKPLLIISMLSGWKFDDLGITIHQRLCEALYITGRLEEGGKSVIEMVNTFKKEVYMNQPFVQWVSGFSCRCLSAPISIDDSASETIGRSEVTADPIFVGPITRLLNLWSKSTLASGSWRDALVSAASFRVSRFKTYEVICKRLEKAGRVMDAIACLRHMAVEMDKPTELLDKRAKWTLNVKEQCAKKLVHLGEIAAERKRHDDAISQYSVALSLDPVMPQNILIKRAKAYMAQGAWTEALGDTAEVTKLDPLTGWGYDNVLKSWAEVESTNKPWKDVITSSGHFMVPRFVIYRAVCEQLEKSGRIADAVECLRRMEDDLELYGQSCKTELHREQVQWLLDFKKCCAIKLVEEGDLAAKIEHYEKAITQYSVALFLDSANLPDILVKRSKIYMAKKFWADALDDANRVTMLDPLSPWDCDVVLRKWARSGLASGSWRSVLETASEFKVSKFRIYRALCEYLEIMDYMVDATECFHQMTHELPQDTENEQIKWTHEFKSRCCDRSEALGDTSMNGQQYDEAISLFSVALSLNSGNPIPLLTKRSQAYEARGLWVDVLNNANEIITFDPSSPFGYEKRYTALHGAGRHQTALEAFEMMLLKMSTSSDSSVRVRCQLYATTKEVIRGAVQHAIRESPPVLINTTSGRVCKKSEQAAAFELLPIYTELILTTATTIDHARIRQEVAQYYRYAALSHKWVDNEPLFEKVVHIVIYDLDESPAHNKLQTFCRVVRDAGFHWAWSDTCCINKADHHVLQEALVLMFNWYQGSALTAVLLHDIHSPSQRGDLVRSIWNRRAWTLQEYHASKVVRFYNRDWTPYLNLDIFNHKESPEIISEMEAATGVSAFALRALQPGPDDIRDKLRLASTRQTTRVEDVAYSLLGIFSISLPIVYGEGDKALGKLLAQLLTSSGDASILAWTGRSSSFNSCLPTDIAVFSGLPTTHVPQIIRSVELDTAAAKLSASSLNAALVMQLYDQLDELSVPFFVGQRMKLPCITFKLGPASTREGSPCMFRAQTVALGIVEISTNEDLSRFDSLYLVYPWIDFLLDRQPVGSSTTETLSEGAVMQSTAGFGMGITPVTGHSNVVSTVPETRAAWFMNITRLGITFGGWPTTPTTEDVASLRPPSSVTQTERRTRAYRAISRLKQPFGALLLTKHLGHVAAYRRVATESLITVQVKEITPAILNRLVSSVRVLDVL